MACLKPSPNNNISSPASQASSVRLSPTVNLSREYTLAIQTISYNEIQTTFYEDGSFGIGNVDGPQLLEKVLKPSRESIQEALSSVTLNSLTHLAASYFEHSEHTCRLYLLLHQSVHHARSLYAPVYNLLDDLPSEFELSPSKCELAFNVFFQFDRIENPFHSPNSRNFDDMRQCLSQLRQELNNHLQKSRSKVHLVQRCSMGCAVCLIMATVGVAISAAVIATHALVALVACPMCPAILPSSKTRKGMVHVAQLEAAAKGAYIVHKDLDTIDRLVARLNAAVESDRLLIHLGLERGRDRYNIQEIVKQLRRNRPTFEQRLVDLEEHLFLCFAAINRARILLLQEIHMHQTRIPSESLKYRRNVKKRSDD